MTLGMLTDQQTDQLKQAGLDYYNHNLDSSEEYYAEVISTRTYQDRLDTFKTCARCWNECVQWRHSWDGRKCQRSCRIAASIGKSA